MKLKKKNGIQRTNLKESILETKNQIKKGCEIKGSINSFEYKRQFYLKEKATHVPSEGGNFISKIFCKDEFPMRE